MKLNFSLLFIMLSFSLFGKVDSIPEFYDQELGMDASFINNFLPADLRLGLVNTYFFSYRKYKSPEKFKRMNLSFDLSGIITRQKDEEQTNEFVFDVNYRIGWGRRKKLYKNFDWFFGTDLLINPNFSTRNASINRIVNGVLEESISKFSTNKFSVGTGWFLGFQYQFNQRFSLYTESNLLFWFRFQNSKTENEDRPEFNSNTNTYTINRTFALPNDITFFYRF